MIALLLLLSAQAGDPPPAVVEDPVGEEGGEELPPPIEEREPLDDDEVPKRNKRLRPLPEPQDEEEEEDEEEGGDDEFDDDDEGSVCWGGSTGCAVGGVVPAGGAALGLSLFYGGSACGDVAGAIGGMSGALIGIPSLLLLGPCAAGGAACGASMGAFLSGNDPLTALIWSLPGVGLGLAGGVVASVGVLVSSSTESGLGEAAAPLGTSLVVIGGLAAAAAGPLAVAGSTFTQEPWQDALSDFGLDDPPLRDGGVEAKHKKQKKKQEHEAPAAAVLTTSAPSQTKSMIY